MRDAADMLVAASQNGDWETAAVVANNELVKLRAAIRERVEELRREATAAAKRASCRTDASYDIATEETSNRIADSLAALLEPQT